MFDSIGWGEILVLAIAGLFILGPERLPSAAAWLGKTVRQVREYATGARDQLRDELGPEFDTLRKPLEDLQSLRNLDPRRAVTRHLLDGLDDPLKPNGFAPGANGSAAVNGTAGALGGGMLANGTPTDGASGTGTNGTATNGTAAALGGVFGGGAAPNPAAGRAASSSIDPVLNWSPPLAYGERPPVDPDAT